MRVVKYYSVREQQILIFNKLEPASIENLIIKKVGEDSWLDLTWHDLLLQLYT